VTSEHPISRFPVADVAMLPDDVRRPIEEIAAKSGFVPNVFSALAHRPAELRAFMAYHDALMDPPPGTGSGLSKAEREMVVVATSGRNDCLYCVVAHGAILRIRSKRPQLADQLAVNPLEAELSARERAIVGFAVKVATDSAGITAGDFEHLRECGLGEAEIWDVGAIAAFFSMSNRLANMAAIRPNAEFYTMGRDLPG
jgi:uncharacterized peroxidase-related enzyme